MVNAPFQEWKVVLAKYFCQENIYGGSYIYSTYVAS